MFDLALLESSPARARVLKKGHYLYATACGAMASLACFFALRRLSSPTPIRTIGLQSLVFGAVLAAFALMLCYVYAESRKLALNTAWWLALTLLLNFAGFVCFLVYAAAKTGDWKRAAIPCVYATEVLLVAAMSLVPLIYTEALPKAVWRDVLDTLVPPPPPAAPAPLATQTLRKAPRRLSSDELLKIPPRVPATIAIVHDEPLPPAQFQSNSVGVVGAIGNGQPGGALDPVLQNILRSATPQPPPPQRFKPAQPLRVRVGGNVIPPNLIYQPKPEYPELAKLTRTEGAVELEAVIGKDGTIDELKVLRGHPLLVRAALEAVRQWRYQPTLLNGEPIEVVTEITVNFKLGE
jgi:protein TonB